MAKYGLVAFRGDSRTKYVFTAYDWGEKFRTSGALYLITVRGGKKTGGTNHDLVYVGTADDIATKFNDRPMPEEFKKHYANCICIQTDNDRTSRETKKADLIKKFNPPANR